ncbi:type I polyketide synthase, partial [Nocardia sp. NPDC005978]|uniref:type I polyketide synthase n=1 Tax=Nocardia sp. NPDC005978 TaxID=3156725 RepID=UPI0033BF0B07
NHPLWLGTIKSNLGHTQAAAGIAGVIKTIMAIQHGVLPPTLHVDRPSDVIDWAAGDVELLTEARLWETQGRPRRAGVSSFGVSGTNAHVIVEQAPGLESSGADVVVGDEPRAWGWEVVPWVLSGRSAGALAAQAGRLTDFVQDHADPNAIDIGSALAGRTVFEHRAVVLGGDRGTSQAGLGILASGEPGPDVVRGKVAGAGKTVFLFPGQGSQWVGMGRELYDTSPEFAAEITKCSAAFAPLLGWSLAAALKGSQENLDLTRVDVVQPLMFAVMAGLVKLWAAVGVRPDAVIGHSQGEIAAGYAAGALTLTDAARIVALRSGLMARFEGQGAMVWIQAGVDTVREMLTHWPDLELAAVNGPISTVVTGDRESLAQLVSRCDTGEVRARWIANGAGHSRLADGAREEFLDGLGAIDAVSAGVEFFSSVTGDGLDTQECNAEYWFRNLRQTVLFQDAVEVALANGCEFFIEVSPHPVLITGVTQIFDTAGSTATVSGTLRRDDGGLHRFLTSAAEAFVAGVDVHWQRIFDGHATKRIDLPTYAFQRRRFWLEPGSGTGSADVTGCGLTGADHALLGAVIERPETGGLTLTGRLSVNTHPWLSDHGAGGISVFPGAGFVELAIRAGDEVGCGVVQELALMAPLVLPDGDTRLQVLVDAAGTSGRREFSIYSCHAGVGETWVLHARGELAAGTVTGVQDSTVWPPTGAEEVDLGDVYGRLATRGYEYGPAFRGLRAAWRRADEVFAEIALPDDVQVDGFGIHPALLDSALHALGVVLLDDENDTAEEQVWLPFLWEGIALHTIGAAAARVRLRRGTTPGSVSVEVADRTGAPVLSVRSLTARPVSAQQLAGWAAAASRDRLFDVVWTPVKTAGAATATTPVSWEDVGDEVTVSGPVVLEVDGTGGAVPERARAVATRVLDVV